MEMKSMELSESKIKANENGGTISSDASKYPYGLEISLDTDGVKKLGLDKPEIGKSMMLHAMVEIVSINQNEKNGEPELSVRLQITDMALGPTKEMMADVGTKLYGG